jgi:hypothetical protein
MPSVRRSPAGFESATISRARHIRISPGSRGPFLRRGHVGMGGSYQDESSN